MSTNAIAVHMNTNSGSSNAFNVNRWLNDVIAFTGHEWRNELTHLHLATERLLRELDGPLTDDQRETVSLIRDSSVAMRRISDNYLNLARFESNDLTIYKTLVSPERELVFPLLTRYRSQIEAGGMTYEVKISNPNILLWADKSLLYSVYSNLLSNAIKYGDQGGRIVLGFEERGTMDEINVWNSGPGLPQDELDEILNRFTTGKNAAAVDDSHGIGLYLVRKIAEVHKGHLRAESREGEWVNFVLTLPKKI